MLGRWARETAEAKLMGLTDDIGVRIITVPARRGGGTALERLDNQILSGRPVEKTSKPDSPWMKDSLTPSRELLANSATWAVYQPKRGSGVDVVSVPHAA